MASEGLVRYSRIQFVTAVTLSMSPWRKLFDATDSGPDAYLIVDDGPAHILIGGIGIPAVRVPWTNIAMAAPVPEPPAAADLPEAGPLLKGALDPVIHETPALAPFTTKAPPPAPPKKNRR